MEPYTSPRTRKGWRDLSCCHSIETQRQNNNTVGKDKNGERERERESH